MEVIHISFDKQIESIPDLTLALGFFDGFHLGHQELAIKAVLSSNGPVGILLFDNPPSMFIDNGKEVSVLSDYEDKIAFAKKLRFDYAFVLATDKSFYELSGLDFIKKVLLPLGVKNAVAGSDFHFGKDALGDISLLEEFIHVTEIPLLEIKREKVSSSSIKNLIKLGEIEEANGLLGHPYEVKGVYNEGELTISSSYLLPKEGYYAGLVFPMGIPHKALIKVKDGKIKAKAIDLDTLDGFGYLSFLSSYLEEEPNEKQLKDLLSDID